MGLVSEAQDLVDDDCDPRVEWDVLVTYFEVACDENVEVDRLGASENRCFCEYLLYINERSLMTVLRVVLKLARRCSIHDRVEIASPGLLHFGLTPDLLYAAHQSMPWNPRIARVLHQRGVAISELQLGLAPALWAVVWNMPGEFDTDTERLQLGHHCLKLGLVEVCTAAHPRGCFLAAIEHDGARNRHDHRRHDGQPRRPTRYKQEQHNHRQGSAEKHSPAQPTALSCTV